MDSRKIIVTGANGFIGANLCHFFSSKGYEVHAIVRNGSDNWRLKDIKQNINILQLGELKINALNEVFSNIKPNVVLNAIGADQKVFLDNFEGTWDSNFMTLVRIISSLKNIQLENFVHAGSSFEYGKAISNQGVLTEELECRPVSEYATAKLMQTNYLRQAAYQYLLPTVVLRIFNAYGPFESKKSLVSYVIIKALKNEEIILKNPGVIRDFIYMEDVMNAFLHSINQSLNSVFSLYNIGTGVGTSVSALVDNVLSISDSKSEKNFEKGDLRPENDLSGFLADIKLARSELKWSPLYPIEKGLQKDIEWFSENQNYYENF